MTTLNCEQVLSRLQAAGHEAVRHQNKKTGAGDNQFGVKLGDIRLLAKEVGSDNELALELWKTRNEDARLLATLLFNPKGLPETTLETLVQSITFVKVADWFNAYLLKEYPGKENLRVQWLTSTDRWALRAGWHLTSERIARDPTGIDVTALLDRIYQELSSALPEVQWTMNATLVQIGIHFPEHRQRAMTIGEELGIYRDFPVPRGCTSPFAPIWIAHSAK